MVAVIWLLAWLEEKWQAKKIRRTGGIYQPTGMPDEPKQIGNYRNSEGSGYEDLAMRDKDDQE